MTSRERVRAALAHRTPDQVPVEFGATAVTGMHVTCVAALRDHYGLEPRPVKVWEPYQMLGWIDEDLAELLGLDVVGLTSRNTLFGFPNENWQPFTAPWGQRVLVSEQFRTTTDLNGDLLLYPGGDLAAPPSGRMPVGGFYFDTIIRQEPIDEARLDPADNLEEFGPLSTADLEHLTAQAAGVAGSSLARIGSVAGTGLGDIALVPAPFLKHPKGIRDVEEWYVSTVARRDYVHQVFARQCEIALVNLERVHPLLADALDVLFLCGTDFGTQISTFCSPATFDELYAPAQRLGPPLHLVEDLQALLRRGGTAAGTAGRLRLRRRQPGAVLGRGDGPGDPEGEVRGPPGLLGGRGRHPANPPLRHPGRGPRRGAPAVRDLLPRRRVRLQRDPQRADEHPGGQRGGDDRRGEGVQRQALKAYLQVHTQSEGGDDR
jgi:hypothetical protein